MGMARRRSFGLATGLVLASCWLACSPNAPKRDAAITAPPAGPSTPALSITSFDVAEAGWGDAPVAVHFTWRVTSTTGKLRCLLDVEGDGNFDVELRNCDADTKATPIDALPAHTYTTRGE